MPSTTASVSLSNIYSVLCSTVLLLNCANCCINQTYHFDLLDNSAKWQSLVWRVLKMVPDASPIRCGVKCVELDAQCKAFASNHKHDCALLGELDDLAYSPWIKFSEEWSVYHWRNVSVQMPVFRVSSGSGVSVSDSWISGTPSTLSETQTYRDLNLDSPITLYKHPLIDEWQNWQKSQVKITLCTDTEEVFRLVFDGQNTTSLTWFSRSKLQSSPWSDLTNTVPINYFTIPDIGITKRGFYINSNHGGCDNDAGWFVVLSGNDDCPWTTRATYPSFNYASDTKINWLSGNKKTADEIVIYVTVLL